MEQTKKYLYGVVLVSLLCFSPLQNFAVAGDGPDEVEIDSLAQLYEPVYFDHAMHEEVTDSNCAVCHHHTLGTQIEDENCIRCHAESSATDEIACQECHASNRFEADYLNNIDADNTLYHRDKVGLKAAYHIRCMNCHEENDVANGCQDCHSRTDAGDKFFHAGSYTPPESDKPAHGGGH
ncbi:cytochrome c3 family protein [Thermodesulfobacteriota bacterium]